MSQANVDTVHAIWDAIERGDLDEAFEYVPEDFVLDRSSSDAPEAGVYRGREEIRRMFEQIMEAWSEVEYFETEIIDADDLVVRVGGMRGRGQGSGAEVAARAAQVWTFKEGVPVSMRFYQSKDEALEAIGLSD